MRRGALEDGNVEAALHWLGRAAETGDPGAVETGLLICGDLKEFWHIRGQHRRMR